MCPLCAGLEADQVANRHLSSCCHLAFNSMLMVFISSLTWLSPSPLSSSSPLFSGVCRNGPLSSRPSLCSRSLERQSYCPSWFPLLLSGVAVTAPRLARCTLSVFHTSCCSPTFHVNACLGEALVIVGKLVWHAVGVVCVGV